MNGTVSEDAVRLAMARIPETAAKGLPGLWRMLEKLPRHQWPTFTRGDCGYGSEITMLEHERSTLDPAFDPFAPSRSGSGLSQQLFSHLPVDTRIRDALSVN